MVTQEKSRRAAIVAAARSHFLARGYEGTTIGAIATTVGVSKAAVSYYFPSKRDFLDELVEPLVADLELIIEAAGEPSWPGGVRLALGAYFDRLLEDRDLARWMDTDLALRAKNAFGDRLSDMTHGLVRIIGGTDSDIAGKARALAVVGGLWRPLLELEGHELLISYDEILDAAMISFAPIA